MTIKEIYERPLKQIVEEMDLIDIKVYPGEGGEMNEILLKYVPGRGKEKADWEKYADMFEDGGKQ